MGVIVVFIDGIGIGHNDLTCNPTLQSRHQFFSPDKKLPFNGKKFALDACLNVKGLPQSATGQTTIYTGQNASILNGKHLFGFPNAKLKELLVDKSIFVKLNSSGYRCKFINAFRPVFFTTPDIFKNTRLSATSEMNRAAGLPFCSLNDVKNEKALYHEFTNRDLIMKGYQLPLFDCNTASTVLIDQADQYDLILYEYFLTDIAGHSKNMNYAISELNKIESLIFEVIKKSKGTNNSVIVCSDHGNIENIKSKSHTLNPAFFAIWTKNYIKKISSLMDVYSIITGLVKSKHKQFPDRS
jgi:hypothetical protein